MQNKYPKNREYFKKLIAFAKEIIKLCNKNDIHMVIYGSFAHFYHTKQNINVNDIDVMIQKNDYPKFLKLLDEAKIEYKYKPKHEEIFIKKNALMIEVDEFGSKYNELLPNSNLKDYINIDFYGESVNIIDVKTIEKIYISANREDNSDSEKILMKTRAFEEYLGRKII